MGTRFGGPGNSFLKLRNFRYRRDLLCSVVNAN